MLKSKRALIFSTTGTPNEIYTANGMHNSVKQTIDQGIFNFTGIEEVIHTFFGAVPYVTDEARKDYLNEIEKIVKENL